MLGSFFLACSCSGLMHVVIIAMNSYVQSLCFIWKILFPFSQLLLLALKIFLTLFHDDLWCVCVISPLELRFCILCMLTNYKFILITIHYKKKLLWGLRDKLLYTHSDKSLEVGVILYLLCRIIVVGSPRPMIYLATGFSALLKVPATNSILWNGPYIQAENGWLFP